MNILAIGGRQRSHRVCVALLAALLSQAVTPARAALTLDEAVAAAQRNDPWLAGSELRQQAIEAQSTAAGSLPDPIVNLGFANLPTDSFDFDQENMTQFKVGVAQVFPRGDSRLLDQKRLALLSPSSYREKRDLAILSLRAGRPGEAISQLESCIAVCSPEERPVLQQQLKEARRETPLYN